LFPLSCSDGEHAMSEEPSLVCVRTCYGMDLAQIYRSKLEAAEIPVLLRYESAGLVYGITVDGLGEVCVMVPEPFAEEAKALLQDVEGPFSEEAYEDDD
jgi:hypothetical protein